MTLEDFYFIAQILAALAVVGSLIFVGSQIKSNTAEQRLRRASDLIQQGDSINDSILYNPELRQIAVTARHSLDGLSEADLFAYTSFVRKLFQNQLIIYIQRKQGHVDPSAHYARAIISKQMKLSPGMQEMWILIRESYDPDFVEYINELSGMNESADDT